ncbi:winged helix-turn-helix domain-containing protein [Burkholderia sp. Ac-20365]|uniref:GntR family transcriptional regulator n=1 Tax=Burkholderia sp. Ac-20365 TaxID=2703897 RepID=UPI00197BB285|nr:winged helix-turn-helix domain-containing protein [Burkholderia sp. Ac-20365]MBN3761372.1 winged helix-turn-helix transcriptional regulator [Burkholderia sp. Ac-20365]
MSNTGHEILVPLRGARRWLPDLTNRRGPSYRAFVDAVNEAVSSGELAAGDRLPSQRFLAARLGLHVNTVNRALRECARLGLTQANTGKGTRIASV